MKQLRLVTLAAIAVNCLPSRISAVDKTATFEGYVSATVTRGGTEAIQFLFIRKDNHLRIEDINKSKPEPINIIDLAAKNMTIIFPHNSTFVHVNLTRTPAQTDASQLPPNFPTPLNISASQPGAHIGPQITPPAGFPSLTPMPSMLQTQMSNPATTIPTPPPMPSMPQMRHMPIGRAPVGAGGAHALPNPMMMPPSPPMMGPFGASELKKTDKIKKIQGFECALYTISDRGQNFEIWATSDAALFPFRLIQRDYLGRHFGPQMLEEQWGELLQKKSLFPLEATLRMQPGGQEWLSFKVDKIDRKQIDNVEQLFFPPKDFHEIDARTF